MPLDHIYDDLQTTEKTIVESLPTRKQAITAVATAKVGHYQGDKIWVTFNDRKQGQTTLITLKVLGHFAVDEMYLTDIVSSHFGEEKARRVYGDFKKALRKVVSIIREHASKDPLFVCFFFMFFLGCQVQEDIEERNKKLVEERKIPYTVLLPKKIPAGIAV